jgi:hypothetical protein
MQILCEFRIKEVRDEERVKQGESKISEAKIKELELLCNRQASALRYFNLQMFVRMLERFKLYSLSNGCSLPEYTNKASKTIILTYIISSM